MDTIFKSKKFIGLTLMVSIATTFGAAPAFADNDTAAVVETAVQNANTNANVTAYTLSYNVINENGVLYLPFSSMLTGLGAAIDAAPDNQADKIKLTLANGKAYQIYYTLDAEGYRSITTSKDGEPTSFLEKDGVLYVPMSFAQSLTNRAVSVYGNTMLLVDLGDNTSVWKEDKLDEYAIEADYLPNSGKVTSILTVESANEMVNTAAEYIGVPYVWGGTTPSGFDCSGLVQYVFAQNGVTLPRTSQMQQAATTSIPLSEAQVGDLVFWGYPAYHVGIYIGNGQYIHAPAPGQNVTIGSVAAFTPTSAGRLS